MPDQLRAGQRGVDGGSEQKHRCENTNPGESHAIASPNAAAEPSEGFSTPLPAICGILSTYCYSKGAAMTSFIAGCIAAILIAILAAVVLDRFQEPANVAFSTSAVRL